MPKVMGGGKAPKEFPYSKKGMKDAKMYAEKKSMKMRKMK